MPVGARSLLIKVLPTVLPMYLYRVPKRPNLVPIWNERCIVLKRLVPRNMIRLSPNCCCHCSVPFLCPTRSWGRRSRNSHYCPISSCYLGAICCLLACFCLSNKKASMFRVLILKHTFEVLYRFEIRPSIWAGLWSYWMFASADDSLTISSASISLNRQYVTDVSCVACLYLYANWEED